MNKTQIALIIVVALLILGGITALIMAPSKQDINDKLTERTKAAKKAVWQFRK